MAKGTTGIGSKQSLTVSTEENEAGEVYYNVNFNFEAGCNVTIENLTINQTGKPGGGDPPPGTGGGGKP